MELNPIQEAAVRAVLEKHMKAENAAARARADEAMLDMYARTGSKTFDARLEGVNRQGTEVSVPIATASVARKASTFHIIDEDAFSEWAADNFLTEETVVVDPAYLEAVEAVLRRENLSDALIYRSILAPDWQKRVKDSAGVPVSTETGELVPGLTVVPGQLYTIIKPSISYDTLVRSVALLGGPDVAALLEGGRDE